MNIDFSSLEAMTGGSNPFEQKQTYSVDTRFYTLKKDDKGNGAAIIRFLPGELLSNGSFDPVMTLYRYNVRSKTSKRFVSEWSPSSIGLPDPFQEKWASLWNSGNKEEAKRYARQTRKIANIKVIKDPANPENEGKIFLLDMSQTLADKVSSICNPSKADVELGTKPKNLFDPINGYDFKLVASIGSNGFTEYTKSDALPEPRAAYKNAEDYIKDFEANGYKISDWRKADAYKSYDELKSLLDNLDTSRPNSDAETADSTTPEVQNPKIETKTVSDLDSLISELSK